MRDRKKKAHTFLWLKKKNDWYWYLLIINNLEETEYPHVPSCNGAINTFQAQW